MTFPKHFSLNFAKSMPFAPLYSISMQYFYPNAISFRLFYRIKRKFKTLFFHRKLLSVLKKCGLHVPGHKGHLPHSC